MAAESWVESLREDLERLSGGHSSASRTEALVPGERREVAVLFIDLAGFTSMSEKLDHETVHRISSGILKALSAAVESSGGVVDKFEGDRIMALFGATVCRVDDCARAASCALRMLEILGEISTVMRRHGMSIGGRIGVSFGSVTVAPDPSGHLTALGDEVNVASRLEQAAQTGTALVTARVREECGDLFEWESLGEISVKGRSGRVAAFRLAGPGRLQAARIERASRLSEAPLTGRLGELQGFGDWLSKPVDPDLNPRGGPRHRLCIVRGEAGSGKTRLLREFAARLAVEYGGTLQLEGRVLPFGNKPFSYWTSLVSAFLGSADGGGGRDPGTILEDLLSVRPETDPSSAGTILDLLAGRTPPGEAGAADEAIQRQRFQALRDLVAAAAAAGPRVVIVMDDLHWADEMSLEALEFVLANCDTRHQLTVMVAARPEVEDAPPRPSVHPNYADVHLMELGNMTAQEICTAMAAVLGYASADDLSGELRGFIVKRAGGNPRFAREILLDLIEAGILEDTGGGWYLRSAPEEGRFPSSLGGAIRSRIDRLPSKLKKALQIAAILGSEFPVRLFSETAGRLGQEDPEDDMAELVSLGILNLTGGGDAVRAVSANELALRVAYDSLLLQNRALMHRCAADALLSTQTLEPGGAGMIARHLSSAGETASAAEWAVRAALEAFDSAQPREASDWASRAIRWLDDVPEGDEKTSYMLDSMKIMRKSMAYAGRTEGLESSLRMELALTRELGLPDRTAEVLRTLGRIRSQDGRIAEAESFLDEGLSILEGMEDPASEGTILADMAVLRMRQGRLPEARGLFERSAELLERAGDSTARAVVLCNLGTALLSTGDLGGAREIYGRAHSVIESSGNRSAEAGLLVKMGILEGMSGDTGKAVDLLERALEMHQASGDRSEQGVALNNLGKCFIEMGECERARRTFRQALMIHRETRNQRSEATALNNLGCIALRDGDLDRARLYLADALRLHRAIGFPFGEIDAMSYLGIVDAETGDIDRAREHFNGASAIASRLGMARPAAAALVELRDLLVCRGVPEAALPLPSGWS